jgi:multisubunit Na+/H+ antiporter MnhB subunit
MIVSYFNKSLGMLFFMACFGALMNPPPYILIGLIFLLMGLIVLPSTNKLTQQKLHWEIKGGTKTAVILVGFLLVCLVVPQVNLDVTSISINDSEQEVSVKKLKQI